MDIFNTDYTQAEGARNGILEDNLRKDREIAQLQRDNFRAAHRAGVRMAFGSDAGVMPHGTPRRPVPLHGRIWDDSDGGDPGRDRNAAQALGRERDVGAIEAGRYADIVAVAGDPLADIRQLEHVAVVIKGGAIVADRR